MDLHRFSGSVEGYVMAADMRVAAQRIQDEADREVGSLIMKAGSEAFENGLTLDNLTQTLRDVPYCHLEVMGRVVHVVSAGYTQKTCQASGPEVPSGESPDTVLRATIRASHPRAIKHLLGVAGVPRTDGLMDAVIMPNQRPEASKAFGPGDCAVELIRKHPDGTSTPIRSFYAVPDDTFSPIDGEYPGYSGGKGPLEHIREYGPECLSESKIGSSLRRRPSDLTQDALQLAAGHLIVYQNLLSRVADGDNRTIQISRVVDTNV